MNIPCAQSRFPTKLFILVLFVLVDQAASGVDFPEWRVRTCKWVGVARLGRDKCTFNTDATHHKLTSLNEPFVGVLEVPSVRTDGWLELDYAAVSRNPSAELSTNTP